MHQPIRSTTAAACLTLACLSPCALAQYDPLHDAPLKRENPVRWSMDMRIDLTDLPYVYTAYSSSGFVMKKINSLCIAVGEWGEEFAIEHADMRIPLPASSAGHQTDANSFKGSFQVRNTELSDSSERLFLGDQQFEYAQFSLENLDGGESKISLAVDYDMICFETRYDEARGASIPWPSAPYPDEAARFLLPQRWIQSDDERVRALARDWVGPEGPGESPALLAKRLASKLFEHHQIQGYNYRLWDTDQTQEYLEAVMNHEACCARSRSGDEPGFVGFDIVGAGDATELELLSAFDFTNLYVAVCRAAGIPARLVIGYDQTDRAIDIILRTQLPVLRPWAEIYLYDEEVEEGWWIPVDVVRQREWSSKAPPIGQAWPFFGNHEHLDETLPIAEAYHPPDQSYNHLVPAMWGWNAGPTQPPALAINWEIRFSATHQSVRSRAP